MEVEDGLTATLADVHDNAIVLEPGAPCRLGDELEHALGLVGRELADLAEARHVPLGQDQEVRVGARVDVSDRDEAVTGVNVIAFAHQAAEEALVRQREFPPR